MRCRSINAIAHRYTGVRQPLPSFESLKMSGTTRHLDLGCGDRPRNPYACLEVFGVDLRTQHRPNGCEIRAANLAIEPIPFPDNFFDSLSAYDFLEHIPRVLTTADSRGTRFPFVELLNDIHRVLKPNGRFYASTPFFPAHQVFGDPTHVNFITQDTHEYFTRPLLVGKMYGFIGDFTAVRTEPIRTKANFPDYHAARTDFWFKVERKLRRLTHMTHHGRSHLLWEWVAIKS